MADISGGNRIELESQILCSALRLSWADDDSEGVFRSARELYQLFPDLLPPPRPGAEPPDNLYDLLEVRCDLPQSAVLAGYFRSVKAFLREHDIKNNKDEYNRILNAGFILRKPRLRLSHDLVVARQWLIERHIIPDDGTLERVEELEARGQREPESALQMVRTQPIEDSLHILIELLKYAQIIGPAEVQALTNQMSIAPEVAVSELILSAGYVTEQEMKSLQLAEYLLSQEKITMAQFAVAMYDERTQGIRMAESLQVRGWLDTQVRPYGDSKK
ncbi:MAG TPA: hypothetical protein V6C81_29545 [Planktothrix sp.]|jgi:hypothetical protein